MQDNLNLKNTILWYSFWPHQPSQDLEFRTMPIAMKPFD